VVLNADGAAILSIDEAADEILFNLEMLRFQFGLDAG